MPAAMQRPAVAEYILINRTLHRFVFLIVGMNTSFILIGILKTCCFYLEHGQKRCSSFFEI